MSEEVRWIISGFIALVVVFLAVFLFNLLATPYRMEQERDNAVAGVIKDLQEAYQSFADKIHTQEDKRRIAKQLSLFYEQAGQLLTRKITDDAQLAKWKADVDKWTSEAGSFINTNVSVASAQLFSVVVMSTKQSFSHQYNDDHKKKLHYLNFRRQRLEEIMKRYV